MDHDTNYEIYEINFNLLHYIRSEALKIYLKNQAVVTRISHKFT